MSNFYAIGASLPVNRQAAMSAARSRDVQSTKKITTVDSPTPIRTVPVPAGTDDLTGMKFGRFTVVGWAGTATAKRGRQWVVRCACSTYSVRRTRAITNPENDGDRCEECRHVAHLRHKSTYQTTGKDRDYLK